MNIKRKIFVTSYEVDRALQSMTSKRISLINKDNYNVGSCWITLNYLKVSNYKSKI